MVIVSYIAARPQIDPYWCDWSCAWSMWHPNITLPIRELNKVTKRALKRHFDTVEKAQHSEFRGMKFEDWKYEAEFMSYGGDFEMIIGTP